MNISKTTIGAFAAFAAACSVAAEVPEVTAATMQQSTTSRLVTIGYTLVNAPAVVTLEVQTNANPSAAADDPGWTSIGGEAVWNATGDVWKKVGESGTFSGTITWRPDNSWPGFKVPANGARAIVTAWPLDNTPDYMVVDISGVPAADAVRYYPGVDFLPKSSYGQPGAAVTNNPAYKTTKILMRKIMASGVEWTMGSAANETQRYSVETPHVVTLTNNYYIGVFEVTQAQWKNVTPTSAATPQFTAEAEMRPMEKISYNEIRNSANKTANAAYNWPANPNASSFLGLLRTKTGLDFDIPTEAQWEFAARAGQGSGFWGDGSAIKNTDTDANLNNLARYLYNHGGTSTTPTLAPSVGGTAIVGSHRPNAWGLYDMQGNVWECCLDWYSDNITTFDGKVNINMSNSAQTLSGATGSTRVRRGGSWYHPAGNCRPAHRISVASDSQNADAGLRVVCTAGLQ